MSSNYVSAQPSSEAELRRSGRRKGKADSTEKTGKAENTRSAASSPRQASSRKKGVENAANESPVEESNLENGTSESRGTAKGMKSDVKVVEKLEVSDAATKTHPETRQSTVSKRVGWGATFTTFLAVFILPLVATGLAFVCLDEEHCLLWSNLSEWPQFVSYEWWGLGLEDMWSWDAVKIILGWHGFCSLLYFILPGEVVEGSAVPQLGGKKLKYKLNGHLQFWVTLFLLGFGYPEWHSGYGQIKYRNFPLEKLVELYIPLLTASMALSFVVAVVLYLWSLRTSCVLSDAATGGIISDFWMGRELNPRFFRLFDWKVYLDLRPSLIGWMTLNLGYLLAEQQYNSFLKNPLLLLTIFQGVYTWDALFHEEAILSTLDITSEGLGFMLAFGNITWVPFMYSLQGHYLVYYNASLNTPQLVATSLLFILGYWIFRASNSEKNSFRRDPDSDEVSHLRYMETASGKRLLTSGWWGRARKINYTGDFLIALSWTLLTGMGSPVTLFYFIFLLILLGHRAYRDDAACSVKYGEDWKKYKQLVPYVFIPKVF